MISRDRMAAIDRNAEALGIPQQQLMESSGNAIARGVRDICDPGDQIAIIAGRGNNGGDGFVAARFLGDFDVTVQLMGRADRMATEIARRNWEALEASAYNIEEVADSTALRIPDCDLVVDALLGTGMTGAPREPMATAVDRINAADAPVLSVDVPTGVDADTGEAAGAAVDADRIVTFYARKPGLEEVDAPVTVADIGIPSAAAEFVGPGDLMSIDRDPRSHKGDAGRIVVIGGGPYTGAPALTALATLRAGADLAVVACPESVANRVQGYAPDLIVHGLAGDRIRPAATGELLEITNDADCVVVGPGLGDANESLRAIREFLREYDGHCVVDADPLAEVPEIETAASLICTPHQGELLAMGGPEADEWRERRRAVRAFAAELGHTILVKGHYDIITDGDHSRVSRTGNPGMTVGGTGDVLAGIVAAMFAQQSDALAAGAIAAYINGRAGDIAVSDHGHGLLASDVLEHVPAALMEDTHDG